MRACFPTRADVNKIVNFTKGLLGRPPSAKVIKEQQTRRSVIAPSGTIAMAVAPLVVLLSLAAEDLFDMMKPSDDVIAAAFRRSGVLRAWRTYSVDLTGASGVTVVDTTIMLIALFVVRGCCYGLEIGISRRVRTKRVSRICTRAPPR